MEPSTEELNQIADQIEEDLRRADEAERRGDTAAAHEIKGRALALAVRTLERSPETFALGHEMRERVLAVVRRLQETAFKA